MEALLPLIITFGLMWALLIRPQQRRVRQHQELVATLSAGDEVITSGGIVGTIVSVVDDIVTLEVAPGTSIRVLRSAVQSRIAADAGDDGYEDDEIDGDIDGDLEDDLEDAFDEDAFDAEPVAEPPHIPAIATDITTTIPQASPPPSTPPPTGTGEKA